MIPNVNYQSFSKYFFVYLMVKVKQSSCLNYNVQGQSYLKNMLFWKFQNTSRNNYGDMFRLQYCSLMEYELLYEHKSANVSGISKRTYYKNKNLSTSRGYYDFLIHYSY